MSQPDITGCIFSLLKNACVLVICVEQTGERTLEEDPESLRLTITFPFHVIPTVPLFNTVHWFNSWPFCSLCFMVSIRTFLIPRKEVISVDKHCQRPSSLHKSFTFYGIIVSSNKQHPKEVLKMKLLLLPVKP